MDSDKHLKRIKTGVKHRLSILSPKVNSVTLTARIAVFHSAKHEVHNYSPYSPSTKLAVTVFTTHVVHAETVTILSAKNGPIYAPAKKLMDVRAVSWFRAVDFRYARSTTEEVISKVAVARQPDSTTATQPTHTHPTTIDVILLTEVQSDGIVDTKVYSFTAKVD